MVGDAVHGIIAVSYTHLDVYKRQEPVYSMRANAHGINDLGNTYIEVDLTEQYMWYYPVSYTHLDVYKRQDDGCHPNEKGSQIAAEIIAEVLMN